MTNVKMAFVDLETTGLDADNDVPLEFAMVLTDEYGRVIDEIQFLINEPFDHDFQYGVSRGFENEFVRDMHDKSGLWEDLGMVPSKADALMYYSRSEVEIKVLAWLAARDIEPQSLSIAGNSIGSLDRPFLIKHFPDLNRFLSHRNIDISSFREVAKLRNPELLKNMEKEYEHKPTHRALDDCYSSIDQYLAFCDEFLITED